MSENNQGLGLSEDMSDLSDILLSSYTYDFLEHHWGCYNEWYNKYRIDLKNFLLNKDIKTIVDLGANTGSVLGFLARSVNQYTGRWPTKIIGIEPNPDNFKFLIATMNGLKALADKIEAYHPPYKPKDHCGDMAAMAAPFACFYSDKDTMSMCAVDENRGGFFLSGVSDIKSDEIKSVGGEVRLFTFEYLMSSFDVDHVDLLKLDVEGAEWNIIENSTMIKKNVSNIVVEIHDKTVGEAIAFFGAHLPMFDVFKINNEQFFLQKVTEQ